MGPESTESKLRKKVSAKMPGVQVRFYREEVMRNQKSHFLPQRDLLDVEPKYETVSGAKGQPAMYQLPLQPANALTVHKV